MKECQVIRSKPLLRSRLICDLPQDVESFRQFKSALIVYQSSERRVTGVRSVIDASLSRL